MARTSLFVVVFAAVACSSSTNNYSSAKDSGPDGSGGAAGAAGAAGTGATGATGGGGADAGTDAPVACTTKTFPASLLADVTIIPEILNGNLNCDATITLGTNEMLSVGGVVASDPSRTLLRFQLTDAVAAAIPTGKVKSAKLTLYRSPSGCPNACPNEAGPLSVFPLTSKWTEGKQNSEGAQWCYGERLGKQLPWGEPGAKKAGVGQDHGDPCGQVQYNGTDEAVSVDLDPKPLLSWADPANTLSLLLVSGGAKLFMYSKENAAKKPAQLSFEICQ